jgi:hypothetical protein
MTNPTPDIFRNVHKGIRKALCEACIALGRADDPASFAEAQGRLRAALHFVAHHGENEDLLLLPLLADRAPDLVAAVSAAHDELEQAQKRLVASMERTGESELYAEACAFMAAYFAHMHEEEQVHEPAIRALLSHEELAGFGQKAVERTAPADQELMLGFMLPAMGRSEAVAFLGRLPAGMAARLHRLVG